MSRPSCSLVKLLCLASTWFILSAISSSAQSPGPLPFIPPNKAALSKVKYAKIITTEGDLVFELFPSVAPTHIANFKYLADRGFYKGSEFTIYKPGYIIQGGRPSQKVKKKLPNYSLDPEFSQINHDFGILGMARVGNTSNPSRESDNSQFHILLGPAYHMNGSYTVMGRLKLGKNTLERLKSGSKILNVIVYVTPDKS